MDSPGQIISFRDRYIVLFDGVCNLCNGAIKFIIRRDKRNRFFFSSLQSKFGQEQLIKAGFNPTILHSIILMHNGVVLQRSTAALEIAKNLGGLWPTLYIFKIVPRFIRDALYDLISRNRYRFFGKRDVCMIPTEELKNKFIENSLE